VTRAARRAKRRIAIDARKLEAKRRLAGEAAGPPPAPDRTAPGHRVRPTRAPGRRKAPVWATLSALLAVDTLVTLQPRAFEQRIALARELRRERERLRARRG